MKFGPDHYAAIERCVGAVAIEVIDMLERLPSIRTKNTVDPEELSNLCGHLTALRSVFLTFENGTIQAASGQEAA